MTTEFVVNILKVGLPGLVFLLSLLSYKLLNQEQSKKSPSAIMLKYIEHFMYVSILLAILTIVAPLIEYQLKKKEMVEDFQAEAHVSPDKIRKMEAAVCKNAKYKGRYLLLQNEKIGMFQVFGRGVLSCSDAEHKILFGPDDAKDMGLAIDGVIKVEVSVAEQGQQFVEFTDQ
jgi:hypothetical protein